MVYYNVIVGEADQYGKRITPVRYFRVIIEILYDTLLFLLIMPTYSLRRPNERLSYISESRIYLDPKVYLCV
jgi:hypothetical protein